MPSAVRRSVRLPFTIVAVVAAMIGLGVTAVFIDWQSPEELDHGDDHRPIMAEQNGYVTSDKCRSCHQEQYESWFESYHRTMTQVASPESVKAPLDGSFHSVDGFGFRIESEGDNVFIDMPGAIPGQRERRHMALVTGSHHRQVYWYETGNQRLLGQFSMSYLLSENRWIPRKSGFLVPPDASSHNELGRWNIVCSRCHSTNPRFRPRDKEGTFDTHVAEFGIACEACHGPGAEHVSRHSPDSGGSVSEDRIVNPLKLSHIEQSSVCGQCHSLFVRNSDATPETVQDVYENGHRFRPGQTLDGFAIRSLARCSGTELHPDVQRQLKNNPEFLEQVFWSDGMARVAGREYNGLVESPCYQRGELSCLSCHSMHRVASDSRDAKEWANDQLHAGMNGDKACVQCHEEYADAAAHSHHDAASPGSRCMNCHMPHTSYGLLKSIRSHQISSPSVDSIRSSGRPDACTLCHLDQPLEWTSRHLDEWYGQENDVPEPSSQSVSTAVEMLLTGDAGQRALIVAAMGSADARAASGTDWLVPYLLLSMDDPYDAVRQIAYRSIRSVPGYEDYDYDFLTPPQIRWSRISMELNRWSFKRGHKNRRAVLVTSEGHLDQLAVQNLLRRRDHRPINLSE